MKIFLYVINLQTYIVEYRNYAEFLDFVAVKDYGIRRYCASYYEVYIELRMRRLSNVDRKGWLHQASEHEWTR